MQVRMTVPAQAAPYCLVRAAGDEAIAPQPGHPCLLRAEALGPRVSSLPAILPRRSIPQKPSSPNMQLGEPQIDTDGQIEFAMQSTKGAAGEWRLASGLSVLSALCGFMSDFRRPAGDRPAAMEVT
jgi:hypothetical protein